MSIKSLHFATFVKEYSLHVLTIVKDVIAA